MVLSTARTYAQLKVEDPDGTRFTSAQYLNAFNIAQQQFCIDTRCYDKSTTIGTLVAGTAEYALPTDFIAAILVRFNGLKLRPTSKYELSFQRGSDWTTANGTPTAYLIDDPNQDIWLVPNPTATDVANDPSGALDYAGIAADLAADGDSFFGGRNLLQPYVPGVIAFAADWLLGYITQTPEVIQKRMALREEYGRYRDQAIETYQNSANAPIRLSGGRKWNDGSLTPTNNAFSG